MKIGVGTKGLPYTDNIMEFWYILQMFYKVVVMNFDTLKYGLGST